MKSGENRIPDFIDKIFSKGDKKGKKPKKSEYIGAIIVNIILLYIFNNLLNWHVYFYRNLDFDASKTVGFRMYYKRT